MFVSCLIPQREEVKSEVEKQVKKMYNETNETDEDAIKIVKHFTLLAITDEVAEMVSDTQFSLRATYYIFLSYCRWSNVRPTIMKTIF